ncbi:MAG: (Fe-S)-binding protein [Actinomycetota bacterium]
MADAKATGNQVLVKELSKRYEYDGVQTCAADGMCAVSCPVHIDTGELVRRLRSEAQSAIAQRGGVFAARHWKSVTKVMAASLTLSRLARPVLGKRLEAVPSGGKSRRAITAVNPDVIFFPSCLNSLFAPDESSLGVQRAFLTLCERAGISVAVPEGIEGLCCGTPWKSKGLVSGHAVAKNQAIDAISKARAGRKIPVVSDSTSCTQGLDEFEDALSFVARRVLPRLNISKTIESITLHPTCSGIELGLNDDMSLIAKAVATDVVIPQNWACCGFAGDRGMLRPELTQSATKAEAKEVKSLATTRYASSNRPCEIAMTRATGESYVHLIEVLEEVSR